MDMGLGVYGVPLGCQSRQNFARVALCQKRPIIFARCALNQRVDVSIKPDHNCAFEHQLAGFRIDEGTTACCNDFARAIQQTGNHAPFPISEMRFAKFLEDFWYR